MTLDEATFKILISILVAIGVGDGLRQVARWWIGRIRWHRFDTDIQSWILGKHEAPPPGDGHAMNDDELRFRVSTFLKDARFDAHESRELLDFAVTFARGRLLDADGH